MKILFGFAKRVHISDLEFSVIFFHSTDFVCCSHSIVFAFHSIRILFEIVRRLRREVCIVYMPNPIYVPLPPALCIVMLACYS